MRSLAVWAIVALIWTTPVLTMLSVLEGRLRVPPAIAARIPEAPFAEWIHRSSPRPFGKAQ